MPASKHTSFARTNAAIAAIAGSFAAAHASNAGTPSLPATTAAAILTTAAPEPDPVPTRWEFDFNPEPLRLVRLTDDDGNAAWYAFLTYRVVNASGQDRMLAPSSASPPTRATSSARAAASPPRSPARSWA